jgi:hypothetical protein
MFNFLIININTASYQTSSDFLLRKTKTYSYTKDFNNIEHIAFKDFYKKQLSNIIQIDWINVYNYWNNIADKNAESNSSNKIRPKLLEHLKAHFEIINNYYLRKNIENGNKFIIIIIF